MLAALCITILATRQLVCSAPMMWWEARYLARFPDMGFIADGSTVIPDPRKTSPLFIIHEGDGRWAEALRANLPSDGT